MPKVINLVRYVQQIARFVDVQHVYDCENEDQRTPAVSKLVRNERLDSCIPVCSCLYLILKWVIKAFDNREMRYR